MSDVNDDLPAIEAINIDVRYGVVRAVQEVSLQVPRRSITALVGSNGAGKSSILRALAGPVGVAAGSIRCAGVEITGVATRNRVVDHGIVLVPEGRSAFVTLTVRENLELGVRVGALRVAGGHVTASGFSLADAFELFPVLKEREGKRAQYLSGGEQQMLSIARSLLMRPSVLLIDEPSMGLAPMLVRRIFAVMNDVFAVHDVAVLLVEQDTAIALELSETAYLLEHGCVVAHEPSAALREDPRLRSAYLGHADALGKPTGVIP